MVRLSRLLMLYTALLIGANAALAAPDRATLEALREGGMKKLVFAEPAPVPDIAFTGRDGAAHKLSEWSGQWLLVNFWATWCAPCRKEMPSLYALQGSFGDKGLTVLPIASGPNAPAALDRFLGDAGVTGLTIYLDPTQALSRQVGVLGLPTTLLIDPSGRIVARMVGDADWSGDSARAIIAALLAG